MDIILGVLNSRFTVYLGLVFIVWTALESGDSSVRPLSPVVAIMGESGAGKSGFIKALGARDIGGKKAVVKKSSTNSTKWYTGTAGNQEFYYLDTLDFTGSDEREFDVVRTFTEELAYVHKAKRPVAGVIYLHDISKDDFETSQQAINTIAYLAGDASIQNIVIATTNWNKWFKGPQKQREKQLKDEILNPLISERATFVQHDGSTKSAKKIVKKFIKKEPTTWRIIEQMVNKKLRYEETDAGRPIAERLKRVDEVMGSQAIEFDGEIERLKAQYENLGKYIKQEEEDFQERLADVSDDAEDKATLKRTHAEKVKTIERERADILKKIAENEKEAEKLKEPLQRLRTTIENLNGKLIIATPDLPETKAAPGERNFFLDMFYMMIVFFSCSMLCLILGFPGNMILVWAVFLVAMVLLVAVGVWSFSRIVYMVFCGLVIGGFVAAMADTLR